MPVPRLGDQDHCRSRVANPGQSNLGKSTRFRQSEVHHVHFDTSVLVRTEEWSDAGLVGQSDQFQPLKGDEGEGKMYRSRFKMRAGHVDFGANSVYDQLEHDPMVRLFHVAAVRVVADHHFTAAVPSTVERLPAGEQIFVKLIATSIDRAQDAPLLRAQFEGSLNALTQVRITALLSSITLTRLTGTGPHVLFSISLLLKARLERHPTPIAVVRGSSSHRRRFI